MKNSLMILIMFFSTLSFGQNLEVGNFWRTKGVHDSLGNFLERAKIQSFLYTTIPNQIQRLRTQDKINMETGETKVFIYRDTLNLKSIGKNRFEVSEIETLIIHTIDSLTIKYNGYNISYVRLDLLKTEVELKALKKKLINKRMSESVEGEINFEFTYQKNGLVKISQVDSKSEWESDYKLIDFNGFCIIQGIVSPPKLILTANKKEIKFLEIDYRFENKNGTLKKSQ